MPLHGLQRLLPAILPTNLYKFSRQPYARFHTLHKSRLFMLPAKSTDSIHNPIHLPEGHTVHPLVQVLKCCLHRISVGVVAFMVIGEEHLQDGIGVTAVVGWVLGYISFQGFDVLIHSRHRPSSLPASFCRPGGSCSGTVGTRP